MFEEFVNLKTKCVFKDNDKSKAVSGILKKIENNFILIESEDGNKFSININSIISLKEVLL